MDMEQNTITIILLKKLSCKSRVLDLNPLTAPKKFPVQLFFSKISSLMVRKTYILPRKLTFKKFLSLGFQRDGRSPLLFIKSLKVLYCTIGIEDPELYELSQFMYGFRVRIVPDTSGFILSNSFSTIGEPILEITGG